jgi:hypothetical protein
MFREYKNNIKRSDLDLGKRLLPVFEQVEILSREGDYPIKLTHDIKS